MCTPKSLGLGVYIRTLRRDMNYMRNEEIRIVNCALYKYKYVLYVSRTRPLTTSPLLQT